MLPQLSKKGGVQQSIRCCGWSLRRWSSTVWMGVALQPIKPPFFRENEGESEGQEGCLSALAS